MRYRGVYEASRAMFAGHVAAASIAVERIAAPILVLSAGDDDVWPSDAFAAGIIARRVAAGRLDDRQRTYAGAGHGIGLPDQPTYGWNLVDTGYSKIALGGSPAAYARANRDAWDAITSYLRDRCSRPSLSPLPSRR
jgi:uncharacterized protein